MAMGMSTIVLMAAMLLIFGCASQQPSSAACPVDESVCGPGTVFNAATCKCDAAAAAPAPQPLPDVLEPQVQNATNDSQAGSSAASDEGAGSSPTTQNVERTGTGVAPDAGSNRPPSGQISCTLKLDPQEIAPGGYALVSYDTYSEREVRFTYNCGEQVTAISNGGLVSGAKLCQFNKSGRQQVWIKAGGIICAQANLTVGQVPDSFMNCYVNQSSMRRNLEDYYYSARVQFSGFSAGAVLEWRCGSTTANKTLNEALGAGMPLYEEIYCDFPERPGSDAIPVSISGFSCGAIPTR